MEFIQISIDDIYYLNSSINHIFSSFSTTNLITVETFMGNETLKITHLKDDLTEEIIYVETKFENNEFFIENNPKIISNFRGFKKSMQEYFELSEVYASEFNSLEHDKYLQREFLYDLLMPNFESDPENREYLISFDNYFTNPDINDLEETLAIKCLIHYIVSKSVADERLLYILPPSLTFEEINLKEKQDLNKSLDSKDFIDIPKKESDEEIIPLLKSNKYKS